MTGEQEQYFDLASRIDEAFGEIDSDTCVDLRQKDEEYRALCDEQGVLTGKYPFIEEMTDGNAPDSLSTDEIAALTRYLVLEGEKLSAELRALYYRGHADCLAYLKKIEAI